MEGVGFKNKNLIVILEKELILFTIPAFCCVILFIRLMVNVFIIKKKKTCFWRFVV
jgi:hypothetical protein